GPRQNDFRHAGFSLITTSILLTAAALVFVSVLPGQDYNQKIIENNRKLEKIDEAMRSFMAANGRRPCPADGVSAVNTATFGQAVGSPGACAGAPLAGGNLAAGSVPTKAIALPEDYAVDAFGHRFTYVIDVRATSNASCLALGTGGISIVSATGGT